VSVGNKIVDGVRAGLGSLLDKIRSGESALEGVAATELEQELVARKALRARTGAGAASDNPRARDAGAGVDAARRRAQAAAARARKASAERAARPRPEPPPRASAPSSGARAAGVSDEDFRRFRDDVKSGRRTEPSSGGGAAGGRARPFPFGASDKIAAAYKTLDLPDGASFDQVKSQYRKLMRKYHPDMHTASPQKQKAATELSMQVTQAYNQLDEYLNKKS
jgi:DnaJ-domain-containing protein 1